jgi:hypothetical protein
MQTLGKHPHPTPFPSPQPLFRLLVTRMLWSAPAVCAVCAATLRPEAAYRLSGTTILHVLVEEWPQVAMKKVRQAPGWSHAKPLYREESQDMSDPRMLDNAKPSTSTAWAKHLPGEEETHSSIQSTPDLDLFHLPFMERPCTSHIRTRLARMPDKLNCKIL